MGDLAVKGTRSFGYNGYHAERIRYDGNPIFSKGVGSADLSKHTGKADDIANFHRVARHHSNMFKRVGEEDIFVQEINKLYAECSDEDKWQLEDLMVFDNK